VLDADRRLGSVVGLSQLRPLPYGPSNVAALLAVQAGRRPRQDALVDRRRRHTYRQLDALVDQVASGFGGLGIEPHDRIAVSMPNSCDIVVAFLACMRLGAVFVGIHPGLAGREKAVLVADAAADLVVTTQPLADSFRAPSIRAAIVAVGLDGDGIATLAGPPRRHWPPADPFAPAALAYTSGTTGTPKGVVHDQHHILLPAGVIVHDRMRGRAERVGVHLPLTTLNVEILGPVLALVGGGTCICIDGHEPGALADVIARERVEHLSTSPAVVHDLVEHPDITTAHLAGVRLGVGGVTCPERLRVAYRERFGRDFTTGYGLTEAPTSVTQETERVPHRAGASGTPMAHVAIEVIGDDGDPVTPGTAGEITVVASRTGPWAGCWSGMHGYHDRPVETARALAGGRLHTGDTGWLDATGSLHVADRRSEVINRGGSKVSPAEVERVLSEHPDVADCVVLGRPDARLGESVVAGIEVRAGRAVSAADLAEHCARSLARYKVPGEIAVVARLPRNPMGKVVRGAVLELFDTHPDGQVGEEASVDRAPGAAPTGSPSRSLAVDEPM
jgi:long-chain acyl-CoA synthetase